MENADMVGLDMVLAIHEYILKHIDASPGPSPILREKVKNQELGFKTGRGFFEWSEEEAQKSRERLLLYLIDCMKREQAK